MSHPGSAPCSTLAAPPDGPLVPPCPAWCTSAHRPDESIRVHLGRLAGATAPDHTPLFVVDGTRVDARRHPSNDGFGWEIGEVTMTLTTATPATVRTVEDLSIGQAVSLADTLAESSGHPLDLAALLREAITRVDAQVGRPADE